MTDQKEPIEQQNEVTEQVEQSSPVEQLRGAMAGNYIDHCINARVAECSESGVNPLHVGGVDAICTVIAQVVGAAGPDGMKVLMNALGHLVIEEVPVIQYLVKTTIVNAASQGTAFALLGELQAVAVEATVETAMQQVYRACMESVAPAAERAEQDELMKPFASAEEAAPAAKENGRLARVAKHRRAHNKRRR